MKEELLSMEEAAVVLGVAEAAVARRLLSARGLATRIGKRVLVVSRADLEAFAKERGENPGPGRPRKKSGEKEETT